MTQPPPPPVPGDRWRRFHPLSPVVRFGRLVVGLAVIAVPSLVSVESGRHRTSNVLGSLAAWGVVLVLSVGGGVVSWLVTRWRIEGGDLRIETGLVRRQSYRIPLARIQAVDIVSPLLARALGLAEVRVVSAGRGAGRGRLQYLTAAEAPVVRARLLALAHGLAAETPEPPAQVLLKVDNGRLVAGTALRGVLLVPLLFVVAMLVTIGVAPRIGVALVTASFWGIVSAVVTVSRIVNAEWDVTIAEAGDGLRVDRGLLQRRHETIPFGRIQAVRLVQPLLWRPLDWARLELDVARQYSAEQRRDDPQSLIRTLIPVARTAEVLWLLGRVLPEASPEPPPRAQAPRRAWLRAPLSRHLLAAWHGNRYAYARTGRVTAATVIVPLHKVQSVRLSRGPLQRVLRLASVYLDTAGRRWQARALQRDAGEAEALLHELSLGARVARRQSSTAPSGAHPAMA